MKPTPTAQDWHAHYAAGRDFRPLSDTEQTILRERLSRPDGAEVPRAMDVACGTGELARLLAGLGYLVDAVDFAEAALERAAAASAATSTSGITYHCCDVTTGDIAALPAHDSRTYEVITLRRALAHLPDRTRTVAELAGLLAPDGILCVITPHADRQPENLRGISLDDAEIALLTDGWAHTDRMEAGGSTVLLLRGPQS